MTCLMGGREGELVAFSNRVWKQEKANLFLEQQMPTQFISKPPSAQLKGSMDQTFCELATRLLVERN